MQGTYVRIVPQSGGGERPTTRLTSVSRREQDKKGEGNKWDGKQNKTTPQHDKVVCMMRYWKCAVVVCIRGAAVPTLPATRWSFEPAKSVNPTYIQVIVSLEDWTIIIWGRWEIREFFVIPTGQNTPKVLKTPVSISSVPLESALLKSSFLVVCCLPRSSFTYPWRRTWRSWGLGPMRWPCRRSHNLGFAERRGPANTQNKRV